ncbi:MAG: hypothetical protein ACREE5_06980 [Acetobacteraceae bacterium]
MPGRSPSASFVIAARHAALSMQHHLRTVFASVEHIAATHPTFFESPEEPVRPRRESP